MFWGSSRHSTKQKGVCVGLIWTNSQFVDGLRPHHGFITEIATIPVLCCCGSVPLLATAIPSPLYSSQRAYPSPRSSLLLKLFPTRVVLRDPIGYLLLLLFLSPCCCIATYHQEDRLLSCQSACRRRRIKDPTSLDIAEPRPMV